MAVSLLVNPPKQSDESYESLEEEKTKSLASLRFPPASIIWGQLVVNQGIERATEAAGLNLALAGLCSTPPAFCSIAMYHQY